MDQNQARGAGTCFGYEVRSSLPFRLLRRGSGTPLVVVEGDGRQQEPSDQPFMEWTSIGGQPFHARLYVQNGGFSLWIDPMGGYLIDTVYPSLAVPPGGDPLVREERLWGIPAGLCFLERGDLSMHASAVDVEGSALLFAAPGHFGKTTLAAAFLQGGHRVLSEDISCCTASADPSVLPGPALLRIRRDVYERLEFPGTEVLLEEPHRVHLGIDEERRGDGLPVPLRGIVLLRELDEGEVKLERVDAVHALPDLWTLSFKVRSEEARARCFQGIVALADSVPVWNLYRPLRFGNLPDVVDRVQAVCLS